MKQCQLIALIGGKKGQRDKDVTAVYHRFQKPGLFSGFNKRYTPKAETEGETPEELPDENQKVQFQVMDCLREVEGHLTEIWDLILSQDVTNTTLRVDVVVKGKTILEKVPVSHLLWLEKQLVDLRTNLGAIPVLDPQENWKMDPAVACFSSDKSFVNRAVKKRRVLVRAQATKEHPAQTEVYEEAVNVGRFDTIKFSGAIKLEDKDAMLERVGQLLDAVVTAREEANSRDAVMETEGEKIFDFILGRK